MCIMNRRVQIGKHSKNTLQCALYTINGADRRAAVALPSMACNILALVAAKPNTAWSQAFATVLSSFARVAARPRTPPAFPF